MNCQQFTSLIVEAARGRMMDAAARDGAMRHAETCASCAARLAGEQRLTRALRAVATGMKDLSAPARVETQLLAAFRENFAAPQTATTANTAATPAPAALPAPVALSRELAARSSSSRGRMRRVSVVTTTIAASLALVVLVALYRQFTSTETPAQTAGGTLQRDTKPAPAAPVMATLPPPQSPAGATGQTPTGQTERERRPPALRVAAARPTARLASPHAPGLPRMIASRQVIDGGRAVFAESEDERAENQAGGVARPGEAESVTEFIPLVAGAPAATPLESGQVVRVQLPRAALASLGLPLNAERGNEPVKADVLLGNDGLARAIRFVH